MDPDPLLSGIISQIPFVLGFISPLSLVFILIFLLIGSALISASEVAFFSLSPQDIDDLSKEPSATDKKIIKLKDNPRELLATILVANNFINIAIVILSESLLKSVIPATTFFSWAEVLQSGLPLSWIATESLSLGLSFLVTIVAATFVLVLFGEVAPKIYANLNNVRHARLMAGTLLFLLKIFYPINKMLVGWSGKIEEKVYRRRLSNGGNTDKKILDKAIELTVNAEHDREEIDILKGIIKFGDVTAKQIMKSRVDVISIDSAASYKEVMMTLKESGFSRLPVYTEEFDQIIGILYVKDLLGHTKEADDFEWQKMIRENVLYVPEAKKIDDLLKEFQLKRTHIGIVVDEYGGSAGIVTLEDIMEEVVGDIRGEFDNEEEVDFVKIDEKNFIFDGKTLLNDVVRIMDIDDEAFAEGRGYADTLAGLILEIEGRIPKRDKEINYGDMLLKIISVNKRRIERVKIEL